MRSTTIFNDQKTTWAPFKGKKFQIITVFFKKWQIHRYFLQSWASILWIAWTRHFVIDAKEKTQKQCAMQVRNLSGEMTLSPVSCSSCLLSHFISWLLLLSPVSYSCLQSHLLSPSPVSCLLSPVFPLLFYVFCRLFHSPVSHLIFHQSWADASA